MSTQDLVLREREFKFTHRDFHKLAELAWERAGINLSDAKYELVYGRLTRRLRELGLSSFKLYCDLLWQDDGGELEKFTNAITTNLTSFFRESHHFDFLAGTTLPKWVEDNRNNPRPALTIWCAGCSTGEEAYSIAITTAEALENFSKAMVDIIATDIDSNVLATARSGVYKLERVQALSKQQLQKWFLKGTKKNAGLVMLSPKVKHNIEFRQQNLVYDRPPQGGPFDIIFCPNVSIYFAKKTQQSLYETFANNLIPQGILFVGHSETLFKRTERFKLISQSIYQRIM